MIKKELITDLLTLILIQLAGHCAITHQEINRPLKTLVPNDPNLDLVSAIASWLEARGEDNVL